MRLQPSCRRPMFRPRPVVAAHDVLALCVRHRDKPLPFDDDVKFDDKSEPRCDCYRVARIENHRVVDPDLVDPSPVSTTQVLNRPIRPVKDEDAMAPRHNGVIESYVAVWRPTQGHNRT